MNISENKTQIPSVENKAELKRLSEEFKPSDVKFLLSLKSKSSTEEYVDNAKGAISRIERFVANGHSTDNLDFSYSRIKDI